MPKVSLGFASALDITLRHYHYPTVDVLVLISVFLFFSLLYSEKTCV